MNRLLLAFFFTFHPWLFVLITGSALLFATGKLVSVGVAVERTASLTYYVCIRQFLDEWP